jgi:hypothetical protein
MFNQIEDTTGVLRAIAIPSVRGNQIANRGMMRTANNIATSILNPIQSFLADYAVFLGTKEKFEDTENVAKWDGSDKSRFQWIKDNSNKYFKAKTTTAGAVRMAMRDWNERSRGIGLDMDETPAGQSEASTSRFPSGATSLPTTPGSPMSPPDFMTVAEMREAVRRLGVRGFSQMNRQQLVEALREAE